MASIAGKTLTRATLRMPLVGVWHLDGAIDEEVELSGQVTVEIEGEVFVGTIVGPADPFSGSTRVRIVGGAGDLARILPAKNYASGPTVRSLVADILGQERLSETSDQGILNGTLARWQRVEAQASHALVSLLDVVGATWRVLADGTVWIGTESWPELEPPHLVMDEDWFDGVITIAPETPALRPGVTFLGKRIEQVTHFLSAQQLRTDCHLSTVSSALNRFLGPIRRAIDFTKRYPARVAAVNGDGTVSLLPDDPRIRGSGLDRVRVRSGIPGSVTATKGARCLLGFDNGDPSQPYASDWDDDAVDVVSIANGVSPAARIGDTVNVFFPPVIPFSGMVGTLPAVGVLTIATPGIGIIQSGNPKILE